MMKEEKHVPQNAVNPNSRQFYTVPAADIVEQSHGVKILLDMPGVKVDALDIDIRENLLTVEAESSLKRNRTPIHFRRTFQISDAIDVSGIHAKFTDGVLLITLPKSDAARIHKIRVSA